MSLNETARPRRGKLHRLATMLVIAGLGIGLSGCVIAPGRPGWCYWHPYRCR